MARAAQSVLDGFEIVFLVLRILLFILIFLIQSTIAHCQETMFKPSSDIRFIVEYSDFINSVIDTISITTTGKAWEVDPDKQIEIIYSYHPNSFDSTKFDYLSSQGWVQTETTGAIDNAELCWFHPPRHNQYRILETAPFPRVRFPLTLNDSYSRILRIGECWGEFSGLKFIMKYKVVNCRNENWEIESKGYPESNPEKVNTLVITFNQSEGFIKLDYFFDNGTRITMNRMDF